MWESEPQPATVKAQPWFDDRQLVDSSGLSVVFAQVGVNNIHNIWWKGSLAHTAGKVKFLPDVSPSLEYTGVSRCTGVRGCTGVSGHTGVRGGVPTRAGRGPAIWPRTPLLLLVISDGGLGLCRERRGGKSGSWECEPHLQEEVLDCT